MPETSPVDAMSVRLRSCELQLSEIVKKWRSMGVLITGSIEIKPLTGTNVPDGRKPSGQLCPDCGTAMVFNQKCEICPACGTSGGCS